MIDKNKAYELLTRHIGFCECSFYGMEPDPENDFWIPFSEELSKDVDAAIDFLEGLSSNEFKYALEALDELIEKTHSRKLLDEIKRIGIEKGIDQNTMNINIKMAAYLLNGET